MSRSNKGVVNGVTWNRRKLFLKGGRHAGMPKDATPTLYPIFVTAKRNCIQAEKQAASSIFSMTRVNIRKVKKSMWDAVGTFLVQELQDPGSSISFQLSISSLLKVPS